MYDPPHFREERPEVLHAVIRARPLATLVIAADGGFEVNHVPCALAGGAGAPAVLRAHVSRANPLARLARGGVPAVAVFAAEQGYVSPSWYPSKAGDGRVVPTWNYVVVHAHGTLRAIEDVEWLREQAGALVAQMESGRARPWSMADAPADYVDAQLRGIVGLELGIARLEGKWKLGQNRSEADRLGTAAGLDAEPGGFARPLADQMRRALDDTRSRERR
jgi:transcriptional regulator